MRVERTPPTFGTYAPVLARGVPTLDTNAGVYTPAHEVSRPTVQFQKRATG